MEGMTNYVRLRQQLAALQKEVEAAEQVAIEEALALGKSGKLGEFSGATVTLQFRNSKPIKSDEIEQLEIQLKAEKEKLALEKADQIREQAARVNVLESALDAAKLSLLGLESNNETNRLQKTIAELYDQSIKKIPGLSVKL